MVRWMAHRLRRLASLQTITKQVMQVSKGLLKLWQLIRWIHQFWFFSFFSLCIALNGIDTAHTWSREQLFWKWRCSICGGGTQSQYSMYLIQVTAFKTFCVSNEFQRLIELSLSSNQIDEVGADYLAEALRINKVDLCCISVAVHLNFLFPYRHWRNSNWTTTK